MYLVNTIAGGLFALVFMLRISPHLTGIAVLPMVLLPVVMAVLGSLIHQRFEAVQDHFGVMTIARAGEHQRGRASCAPSGRSAPRRHTSRH